MDDRVPVGPEVSIKNLVREEEVGPVQYTLHAFQ